MRAVKGFLKIAISFYPLIFDPVPTQSPTPAPTPSPTLVPGMAAASEGAAIRDAARVGDSSAVRALVANGANPNAEDAYGRTPAYFAAFEGHADTIRALADCGADVGCADRYGETPVFIAANEGRVAAVAALAECGADLGVARAEDGLAPLQAAARHGHRGVAELLRELLLPRAVEGATKAERCGGEEENEEGGGGVETRPPARAADG